MGRPSLWWGVPDLCAVPCRSSCGCRRLSRLGHELALGAAGRRERRAAVEPQRETEHQEQRADDRQDGRLGTGLREHLRLRLLDDVALDHSAVGRAVVGRGAIVRRRAVVGGTVVGGAVVGGAVVGGAVVGGAVVGRAVVGRAVVGRAVVGRAVATAVLGARGLDDRDRDEVAAGLDATVRDLHAVDDRVADQRVVVRDLDGDLQVWRTSAPPAFGRSSV